MRKEHQKTYIYGKHALNEAINNKPSIIRKVFLSPEIDDKVLRDALKRLQIPVAEIKTRRKRRGWSGRKLPSRSHRRSRFL